MSSIDKTNNNKKDRIIVYAHGRAYDVTDFINLHPAGARCILAKNGKDCTKDYDFHSKRGRGVWNKYMMHENQNDSISKDKDACHIM